MEYKVSIIVPVFNVELYISRCLDSILAQTYKNWELILVDDGSTDQSGQICDDYEGKYKNIHVIHQSNQGVSVARNKGIEAASGDYFLFVDPDDWIANDMLEGMITEGQGAELVVCGYTKVYIYDDKVHEEPVHIWKNHQDVFVSKDVYYDVLVKTGMMCNKLFQKDAVGNHRFAPGLKYGEDALFISQVLQNVHSAVIIPRPYYYYFKNRQGNDHRRCRQDFG